MMTTNYEKIKNMTVDEMAELINAITYCGDTDCNKKDCYIKKNNMERLCRLTNYYSIDAKQWLLQEAEE